RQPGAAHDRVGGRRSQVGHAHRRPVLSEALRRARGLRLLLQFPRKQERHRHDRTHHGRRSLTLKNNMPPSFLSPWLETVPDRPRFDPLEGWITADVAVIGGGIVGLMTAWNLAAKGRSVVLLEKNHVATGDTGLTTAFLTRVPDTGALDLMNT